MPDHFNVDVMSYPYFLTKQVTVDSNGEPVDVEFYSSFWGLQRTFQAPYASMDPAAWSTALKSIQAALNRFKQEGIAVAGSSLSSGGVYAP